MREELTKIERIENYLLGRLGEEERKRFEDELEADKELRQEVELQRLFIIGVELLAVKEELNTIHESGYATKTYFSGTWFNLILFLVLVITGVGLFILVKNKEETTTIKDSNITAAIEEEYKDTTMVVTDNNNIVITSVEKKNTIHHPFFIPSLAEAQSSYYSINPTKDTLVKCISGAIVSVPCNTFVLSDGNTFTDAYLLEIKEVIKPSQLILNDLAVSGLSSNRTVTDGALFVNAIRGADTLKPAKGKDIKLINEYKEASKENYYFKIFENKQEQRLIYLPVDILDYEINYFKPVNEKDDYTAIASVKKLNQKIESLADSVYTNTFVGTIPFHYRIEGCMLYSEGPTVLLDIYLHNTRLKLWEADSLVVAYLRNKANADCKNYERLMKAEEYFRWLQSERYGKVIIIKELLNRNYHKGQLYSKLPQHKGLLRLQRFGLTEQEAKGQLNFFLDIFKYKAWIKKIQENNNTLDYYYQNVGTITAFSSPCASGVGADDNTGIVIKTGWNIFNKSVDSSQISSLSVTLQVPDSNAYVKTYIVYKDKQAVVGDDWLKQKSRKVYYLSSMNNVSIVAIGWVGEQLYYGRRDISLNQLTETILFRSSTRPQLKDELNKLDLPK